MSDEDIHIDGHAISKSPDGAIALPCDACEPDLRSRTHRAFDGAGTAFACER